MNDTIFDGMVGSIEFKPTFVTSVAIKGPWEDIAVGDVFVIGRQGHETRIRVKTLKYDKRRDETIIFGDDLRFEKP